MSRSLIVTQRDGYEAGLANKSDPNPYITGDYHDAWQQGFDMGRKERLSWDDLPMVPA